MSDKMREAYKMRRAKLAGLLIQGDDWPGAYRRADEVLSWSCFEAGWQASCATAVMELPKPYAVVGDYAACGGGRSVWDVEYAEKIDDPMCAKTAVYDLASLEAAGLKVTP